MRDYRETNLRETDKIIAKKQPFLQAIQEQGKKTYETLIEGYQKKLLVKLYSHKSDADGLASEIVLNAGYRAITQFLGLLPTEDKGVEIESTRITSISNNKESPDNLENLVNATIEQHKTSADITIFSDLGTFDYATATKLQAEEKLKYTLTTDHHPIKGTPTVDVLNPLMHEIDGGKYYSAALINVEYLKAIVEAIKEDFEKENLFEQEQIKDQFKTLTKKINYLTIIGTAGSSADMQDPYEYNASTYLDLLKKRLIKNEGHPFFGTQNKSSYTVLAESDLSLNLKYRRPTAQEIIHFFKQKQIKINEEEIKKNYKTISKYFATNEQKQTGINRQYLRNNTENIKTINETISKISKKLKIDKEETTNQDYYSMYYENKELPIIFETFLDDERRYQNRIQLVQNLLTRLKLKTEKSTSLDELNITKILDECEQNIISFSDPEMKDELLEKLKKPQFRITEPEYRFVNTKFISGLANEMTAFSKMGYGPKFLKLIESELESIDSKNVRNVRLMRELQEVHLTYRTIIYNGMRILEQKAINEIKKIGPKMYMLDLEDLKKIADTEILENMTGVFGGLITKNRLLPRDYGLLLTKLDTGTSIKISSRVYLTPKNRENLDLGSFYAEMEQKEIALNGGGHKLAASGRFTNPRVEEFLKEIKNIKI